MEDTTSSVTDALMACEQDPLKTLVPRPDDRVHFASVALVTPMNRLVVSLSFGGPWFFDHWFVAALFCGLYHEHTVIGGVDIALRTGLAQVVIRALGAAEDMVSSVKESTDDPRMSYSRHLYRRPTIGHILHPSHMEFK